MGEFFHGWRRKIGVATLVIACAFLGGWIRNFVVDDYVDFPIQNRTIKGLGTEWQSLVLYKEGIRSDANQTQPATPSTKLAATPSGDSRPDEEWVAVDEYEYEDRLTPLPVPFVEIPFVAIVAPLTLLSAYLLLSNRLRTSEI